MCYQYLDLCNTDYGFEQAFCELDAKMYFRIMHPLMFDPYHELTTDKNARK